MIIKEKIFEEMLNEDKKKIFEEMLNADIEKVDIHIDFNDPELVKPLAKASVYFKGIKEHLTYQMEVPDIKVNDLDALLEAIGSGIVYNKVFHKH